MNQLEIYAERQARYQKVIDMYNDGYLTRVIAERCGMTLQMVHYILRKNNIKLRRRK